MAIRELNLQDSDNVEQGWFDDEKGEIVVLFKSGGKGAYVGAKEEDALAFEKAESPGKHVHNFLKPLFPWVRR